MNKHKVTLIPGDGIGPEITESVQDILEAARVPVEWEVVSAGMSALKGHGSGVPPETLESIRRNRVALKGPTTTPLGGGHKSVNVTIRKALDLFANVRPAISLPAVHTKYEDVDLLMVRENIEDTYGGIEHWQTPDTVQCLRLITRPGSRAVIRYGLEMARRLGRDRVTCVHKANIHKMTDGLFLDVYREAAADFPELSCDDMLIDNLCMQLVRHPEQFDVLILPNLFGDIVSDLCAGLVGGLGVAPAANIGNDRAVFEAVHGSAPDIAGHGVANPTALLLSAVQMLRYLGLADEASDIETALRLALLSGIKTRDLGGHATTFEFTRVVINALPRTDRPAKAHPPPRDSGTSHSAETVEGAPQDFEWQVCGVDVFVRHRGLPELPREHSGMHLAWIGNRGTKVFPDGLSDIFLTDCHQARYMSEGPADDQRILALLREIGRRTEWVHIEKLHKNADGDRFFSRAQGE